MRRVTVYEYLRTDGVYQSSEEAVVGQQSGAKGGKHPPADAQVNDVGIGSTHGGCSRRPRRLEKLTSLNSTAKSQYKMQSRFLLYIVIAECSAVLELLASEYEALLIGRNAFLVLDLGFDVVN